MKPTAVEKQVPELKDINIFSMEHNSVLRSCLERKKIGWETMKGWDENSKHNLQVNKDLIETLFQRIENRLGESYKRYDLIFTFFKGFSLQLKAGSNLTTGLPLFRVDENHYQQDITKEEKEKKEPYMLAISEFNKEFETFEQKLNKLAKDVPNQVSLKILAEAIRPYENNIKALYVKIDIMKKSLAKNAADTTDKLKVFSKHFSQGINQELSGKRVKHNVFDCAFDFESEHHRQKGV